MTFYSMFSMLSAFKNHKQNLFPPNIFTLTLKLSTKNALNFKQSEYFNKFDGFCRKYWIFRYAAHIDVNIHFVLLLFIWNKKNIMKITIINGVLTRKITYLFQYYAHHKSLILNEKVSASMQIRLPPKARKIVFGQLSQTTVVNYVRNHVWIEENSYSWCI